MAQSQSIAQPITMSGTTSRCGASGRQEIGDGIISAIDFNTVMGRLPDPKGNRRKITMSGKFLPFKHYPELRMRDSTSLRRSRAGERRHGHSKRKPKSPPDSVSSERRAASTTPVRSKSSGSGNLSKMSEFIVTMYCVVVPVVC